MGKVKYLGWGLGYLGVVDFKVRYPTQAGAFYRGDREGLIRQIEGCFKHRLGPGYIPEVKPPGEGARRIYGVVSPHAGYMYSGPVAAHGYCRLAEDGTPKVFVILGPNHTGLGSGVSLYPPGSVWRTPLGDVEIDSEVSKRIVESSSIIDVDERGHRYEHSIEVQLPFLQYLYGSVRIVAISMLLQDLETSREVGEALAMALKGVDAVIIASTDLTHYEPHDMAVKKDKLVLDAILAMDEEAMIKAVDKGISMCGPGPVAAMITALKKLGSFKPKLLSHRTSGDVTGDYMAVVGYASMVFERA